jgi:2-hydroxychromene-2-carboxylate isomerase
MGFWGKLKWVLSGVKSVEKLVEREIIHAASHVKDTAETAAEKVVDAAYYLDGKMGGPEVDRKIIDAAGKVKDALDRVEEVTGVGRLVTDSAEQLKYIVTGKK